MKNKKIIFCVLVLMIISSVCLVLGADVNVNVTTTEAPTGGIWNSVKPWIVDIIEIFKKILDALIMVLISYIGAVVARKFHIQINQDQLNHIQDNAISAAHGAEEWSDNEIQKNGGKLIPTGSEKADKALEILKSISDNSIVKNFEDTKLKDIINNAFAMNKVKIESTPASVMIKDSNVIVEEKGNVHSGDVEFKKEL